MVSQFLVMKLKSRCQHLMICAVKRNCEFVCNGPCESASKFGVGGRNNRFRSNGDTSQGLGWPSTKNGAEKYQLRFEGDFSRRTALGRRSVRCSTCWFQR